MRPAAAAAAGQCPSCIANDTRAHTRTGRQTADRLTETQEYILLSLSVWQYGCLHLPVNLPETGQ